MTCIAVVRGTNAGRTARLSPPRRSYVLIVCAQKVGPMAEFSPAELDYLTSERRLGRLATADGHLHVVPVGMWRVNSDVGTIDMTGHDFARKRKFRNVRANPRLRAQTQIPQRPRQSTSGTRRRRPGKRQPLAAAICHGRGPGAGDRCLARDARRSNHPHRTRDSRLVGTRGGRYEIDVGSRDIGR